MEYLAFTFPGGLTINAPSTVPQGGLVQLNTILGNAITLFIIAGMILALAFLVWGGISWITSGGDKAKLQSARSKITGATVGLTLLFLSFFILSIISYFFNIELLNLSR